jgi:hypothetical protein
MAKYVNKTIYRNTKTILSFLVNEDITTKKLIFALKAELSDTTRLFTLNNSVAGGSDSEITAVYNSETGYTTVQVTITPQLSFGLSNDYYFFDLVNVNATDSTDRTVEWYGKALLEITAQNAGDVDYDITELLGSEELFDQLHDKAIEIEVDYSALTAAILQDIGFSAGSVAVTKVKTGLFQLVFGSAIFNTDEYKYDVTLLSIDNDDFSTYPIMRHDIISSSTLRVGIYDINSQYNVDADFRIKIERVRQ